VGTLASELRPIAAELVSKPRVYIDANMPGGLVTLMRETLGWDALFVIEHDDLRRASDLEHFRKALEFGRTLITLDRDFLDDKRFPLADSPGIVVCSAPDEVRLARELRHLHREVFGETGGDGLPLRGRKVTLTPDLGLQDA
jgi:predicted nuclease of predicted toxin-antitoxin system